MSERCLVKRALLSSAEPRLWRQLPSRRTGASFPARRGFFHLLGPLFLPPTEELYLPGSIVCWGELRGSMISGQPLARGTGRRAPLSQGSLLTHWFEVWALALPEKSSSDEEFHVCFEGCAPELTFLNMTLFGPGSVNLGKEPHSQ